jgi:hypothetical protein
MFIIETGLRTKGNLVVGTETIDRSVVAIDQWIGARKATP